MYRICLLFIPIVLCLSGVDGKYVEGEINSKEDWEFITRFCFLSAKGTLRFTFEYPTSYGPQHILLYFDSEDQWDAVYKTDTTCAEKVAVINPNNNQDIELIDTNGLSGCKNETIDGVESYSCEGGRIFRSSRARWWYVAISRCDPAPTDSCSQKYAALDTNNNQVIELTTQYSTSGCIIQNIDGVDKYVCNGGRIFRSSRERWWFVAVSHCDPGANDTCTEKLQPLSGQQNIKITTGDKDAGCIVRNISGVPSYICSQERRFRSMRERWWYIAAARCQRNLGSTCAEKVSVLNPLNNQIIYLTTAHALSGCTIKTVDGEDKYVCVGGRYFRSSRSRWWYIGVSRCDPNENANCTEKEAKLNVQGNNQIIYLDKDSCELSNVTNNYHCSGERIFRAARERWWYIAASHCLPLESCTEKIDKLNVLGNNQIIQLDETQGCKIKGDKYVCAGVRYFRSARERWWYIATSRCLGRDPVGISLKYTIHMTNGQVGDYLHREYSADEFYILPIDIAFVIAYTLLSTLTIVCAFLLRRRQLWHTTYKMYMVSVFLWTFYLFLMCLGYGIYGNDGLEWRLRTTKYAARAFESVSIMVFLLMLILVGKGYTVTRGKLSTSSTIKITVFMSLYALVYAIIFVWEAFKFDPGMVLYLYESPPGYAMIIMRIIGYLWFCYAIFFTLKHYPEKKKFYYPLFVFYTLWFLAGPLIIVIAMFAIALWTREKTVVGVENFVALVGHLFFMILTRPSAANKNFPYHVRTSQIGILQNVPHELENGADGNDMNNLGGHAYAVSSPMPGSSSGPDLTGLFVTSNTRSNEKEKEVIETGLNNNEGHVNQGFADPPPGYSSFSAARSGNVRQVKQLRGRMNSQQHLISSFDDEQEDDFSAAHSGNVRQPRGRMNSQAHLINSFDDEQEDDFPVQPTAPPAYDALFQAQGARQQ